MEFTDKLNREPVTHPVPQPKSGEILIQVYATGVTPTEKLWHVVRDDPGLFVNSEFGSPSAPVKGRSSESVWMKALRGARTVSSTGFPSCRRRHAPDSAR